MVFDTAAGKLVSRLARSLAPTPGAAAEQRGRLSNRRSRPVLLARSNSRAGLFSGSPTYLLITAARIDGVKQRFQLASTGRAFRRAMVAQTHAAAGLLERCLIPAVVAMRSVAAKQHLQFFSGNLR